MSQLGTALSSFGSKWWRLPRTARTACECLEVQIGRTGLKDDAVGIALVAEEAHHVEGDEGVFVVRAVVRGVLDFVLQYADHLEDVSLDLDRFADRRIAIEELLRGVRAEDNDLTMIGEVSGLEVAALGDIQLPHSAVGEIDGLASRYSRPLDRT